MRRKLVPLGVLALALGIVAWVGTASGRPTGGATPIKIGILSTCQGPFAPFYPESTAGARVALLQLAGGKPAGTSATSPVTGAQVGDTRSSSRSDARTPSPTSRSRRRDGSSSR